jgi:hypothetical protein
MNQPGLTLASGYVATMLSPTLFPVGPTIMNAEGYAVWASVLTNQNVKLLPNYVFGFPGMPSDVIRVYGLPKILAMNPLPSVCVVEAGTNNLTCTDAGNTYSYIMSDLTSIASQLLAAGIQVIFLPIEPRLDTSFSNLCMPVSIAATARQVNRSLRNLAASTPGVYFADATQFLCGATGTTTPTTTSGAYDCEPTCYRGDLLHPSLLGSFYKGQQIAKVLNTLFPVQQNFLATSPIQATGLLGAIVNPSLNPYDNLLASPLFLTGGGTIANDSSGTSSSIVATTALVQSQVAANQGWKGNLWQVSLTGSYNKSAQPPTTAGKVASNLAAAASATTSWVRLYQAISQSNVAPGDTVEGYVYVELPPQAVNGISAISASLTGASPSPYTQTMAPNYNLQPNCGWSGVLWIPPYTLQPTDTTGITLKIYIWFDPGHPSFSSTTAAAYGSGTNTPGQTQYTANAAQPVSGVVRIGLPVVQRVF